MVSSSDEGKHQRAGVGTASPKGPGLEEATIRCVKTKTKIK